MRHTFLLFLFCSFSLLCTAQVAISYGQPDLKGDVEKSVLHYYSNEKAYKDREPLVSYFTEYKKGKVLRNTHYMYRGNRAVAVGKIEYEYRGENFKEIRIYDIVDGGEKLKRRIVPKYISGELRGEQRFDKNGEKSGFYQYTYTKNEGKNRAYSYQGELDEGGKKLRVTGQVEEDDNGQIFHVRFENGDTVQYALREKTGVMTEVSSGFRQMNGQRMSFKSYMTKAFDAQGNFSKIINELRSEPDGNQQTTYTIYEYQYKGGKALLMPDERPQMDVFTKMTDGSVWENEEYQLLMQFQKSSDTRGLWYTQFTGEKVNAPNWIRLLQVHHQGIWRYLEYQDWFKINHRGSLICSTDTPFLSGDTLYFRPAIEGKPTLVLTKTDKLFTRPEMIEAEEIEFPVHEPMPTSVMERERDDRLMTDAPPPPPEPMIEREQEKIFRVVEEPAKFVGGEEAMKAYLAENLIFPKEAKDAGISGRVIARFVVEKDGSIGDIQILRGLHPACDAEVIRVLSAMPKWTPGKQRGRAIRMYVNVPVAFRPF